MHKTFDEQRNALDKLVDGKAKEVVLNGLKVLHDKYGDAWVDHVDPETLDLADGAACVLGQTYSIVYSLDDRDADFDPRDRWNYCSHLHHIDGEVEIHPSHYGFEDGPVNDGRIFYEDLQEAWEAALGI